MSLREPSSGQRTSALSNASRRTPRPGPSRRTGGRPGLASKPTVVGHSFGGLLAKKLLGDDRAMAAVGIDEAPIKGVLPLPISALRVAFVALRNPGNIDAAVSLTPGQPSGLDLEGHGGKDRVEVGAATLTSRLGCRRVVDLYRIAVPVDVATP